MAVVAVGDFDADEIEAAIKKKFSDLKNPETPRARPIIEVPNGSEPVVSIETDKEMQQTTVEIRTRMKHRPVSSEKDYRRLVVEGLYHSMFNARLDEISQRSESPFMFAYSSTGGMVRTSDSFTRWAMVKQDKVKEALEVLATETRRVELHGFTQSEFERAKEETLRQYQRSVLEQKKQDAGLYASEILRNYFEDESVPGSDLELKLLKKALPTINLQTLNSLAKTWDKPENRVILISGPAGLKAPTKNEVLALIEAVGSSTPTPYQDDVSDKPLMDKAPKPGFITRSRHINEIDTTEWTLSNGAKVLLKTTDFKNDAIEFTAFSPGGHSLANDKDFLSARSAASIVRHSGLGNHTQTQLRKMLSGKVAHVSNYISELEEGLHGSASPQDLQTFFELIYLNFRSPRNDAQAFDVWKKEQKEWVRNRRLSPEGTFFDDMVAFQSKNHMRRRPMTIETLKEVDHQKALSFYRTRFADASDFHFVFVGNVDQDKFKPLVETYIASLPALHRKDVFQDVGVKKPRGRKFSTTTKGVEPKSFFYLTFHGKAPSTPETRNDMDALSMVLDIRLREVLREDMGGVYSNYSYGSISRRPRQEYEFTVFFGCDPARLEDLKKAVFKTIATIQKQGIDESYLIKVRNSRKRTRELDLRRNYFWTNKIAEAYRFDKDPAKAIDDSLLMKVSSTQIKSAARKYLGSRQYVLGILKPEAGSKE
jgi:zinc protease